MSHANKGALILSLIPVAVIVVGWLIALSLKDDNQKATEDDINNYR